MLPCWLVHNSSPASCNGSRQLSAQLRPRRSATDGNGTCAAVFTWCYIAGLPAVVVGSLSAAASPASQSVVSPGWPAVFRPSLHAPVGSPSSLLVLAFPLAAVAPLGHLLPPAAARASCMLRNVPPPPPCSAAGQAVRHWHHHHQPPPRLIGVLRRRAHAQNFILSDDRAID